MKHTDLTQLPDYLRSCRWFAGKAWPIKKVSVADHAQVETRRGSFTLGVIDVAYELGNPERYLLPVMVDSTGRFHDALEDDELSRGLLRLIRDAEKLPSGGGTLRGEREPSSASVWSELPPAPSVKRVSVEQSNTSVIFDDKVILKVIRKLESGLNPEIEMGRFLLQQGFEGVPKLLGSLGFFGVAESTIAVAHEFVPNRGDGWAFIEGAFRSFVTPPVEVLTRVLALGELVGSLHRVLSSEEKDPAFAPTPIGTEDLQRWSASIIGELGVVVSEAEKAVPELATRRAAITERARRLAHLKASGQKIRVHGDLHLGQVLVTSGRTGGWTIFDFEGEPGRSFSVRREMTSPLKDVASMLRSFSYAEAAVELAGRPKGQRALLCRRAFLEGYRKATRGAAFLPSEEADFAALLDAFELDKALYELRYELHNRPSWVKIPAQTLLAVSP
ncbi:MAG: phosphotransferase [Myxococcota bacterium]